MTVVPAATVRTRVLLFAIYAELVGQEEVMAILPAPARVEDLLAWVRRSVPGGDRLPERPLVAINRRHARLDAPLADGDEVALLPPMAGG